MITKILGVDPGLQRTGYGIVELKHGRLHYCTSGVIRTNARASMPHRLGVLAADLAAVIQTHMPDESAIEQIFVNMNPKTTLALGQARGALIAALVGQQLPVSEYTALQIKQAVAGYGLAQKSQIQTMVGKLLNLPEPPGPDASDALAVAIMHSRHLTTPTALQLTTRTRTHHRARRAVRWSSI